MKLVTFRQDDQLCTGVLSQDEKWIYALSGADLEDEGMLSLIKNGSQADLDAVRALAARTPEEVEEKYDLLRTNLAAPIPFPEQDVICLGVNYMDHAAETARYGNEDFDGKRQYSVYFSKRVNEAVDPYGDILSHKDIDDRLDYECELAVIVGRDAKKVKKEDVKDYIFGYTVLNDVSARNIQMNHEQWYFGKSLDGFTPMGPCILTRDSIPYPPRLELKSFVNGELRQHSNTDRLIFDIDYVVSELSAGMTLRAGTIISMGTPSGVGFGFQPPKFMKAGDIVECRVEAIGSLINKVVDEDQDEQAWN